MKAQSEAEKMDLLEIASHVLQDSFGEPVKLAPGEPVKGGSGRCVVTRAVAIDGPSKLPKSFIIKAVNYDYDMSHGNPTPGLLNDWASLQFLTEIAPDAAIAPRFYGGNLTRNLIVMEDMGAGESLVEPLLGDRREPAVQALEAYFRSLGQLNALTYGHHQVYERIRDALGSRDIHAHTSLDDMFDQLLGNLNELCDAEGFAVGAEVRKDVREAARFDAEPGPFLVFSQSDTCPDNCIRVGERMRFFDFEGGWFRNALSDGVRARSNFPTCWCVHRFPDDVMRHAEHIYRAELAKTCLAARDDALFYRELVKACAYWTLYSVHFYRHFEFWNKDETWGRSTVRQRAITRLELLAQASAEFCQLEALGELAGRLAARLAARWGDTKPMELYPAFRI